MPLYEFKCTECGALKDIRSQYDSIPPTIPCDICGMESRRHYIAVGVLMRPDGYSLSPSDPNHSKGLAKAAERKVHKWQLS